MPRKKAPVPTPKHVTSVDKIKRAAHVGAKAGRPKAKPRVKVGSPEAAKLGIK